MNNVLTDLSSLSSDDTNTTDELLIGTMNLLPALLQTPSSLNSTVATDAYDAISDAKGSTTDFDDLIKTNT